MTLDEDLKTAVDVMKRGGIILYPTDTVWGIGCEATRSDAVKKIFELKQRSDSKAMIVLLPSPDLLPRYVDDVPEIAWQLIDAAVDPMTIIYDGARNLAPEIVADDGSVGIRITGEEVSKRLCSLLRRPIVSTSANISGKPSPAFFDQIPEEIKKGVDYVMEARRSDTSVHKPSSVIKIGSDSTFKIIRK